MIVRDYCTLEPFATLRLMYTMVRHSFMIVKWFYGTGLLSALLRLLPTHYATTYSRGDMTLTSILEARQSVRA